MKYDFTFGDIEDESKLGILIYDKHVRHKAMGAVFNVVNDAYSLSTIVEIAEGRHIAYCGTSRMKISELEEIKPSDIEMTGSVEYELKDNASALTEIIQFAEAPTHFKKGEPVVIMGSYEMVLDLIKKGMRFDTILFKY